MKPFTLEGEQPPFKIRNYTDDPEKQEVVFRLLFQKLRLTWGQMRREFGDTSPRKPRLDSPFIYHVGDGQITADSSFAPGTDVKEILPFKVTVKFDHSRCGGEFNIIEAFTNGSLYHYSLFTEELHRLEVIVGRFIREPMDKVTLAKLLNAIEEEFSSEIGFMGAVEA